MKWEDRGFFEHIKDKNKFGVFLDMGSGKTSLLLSYIDMLFFSSDVKSVLIVAPKIVSLSTWQREMEKFDDFRYMKNITKLIDGDANARSKRLSQKDGELFIHIISSGSFSWLCGEEQKVGNGKKKRTVFYNNDARPNYDLIIIDECSQFKDATSKRFKMLKRVVPQRIMLLSGTPFPNIKRVYDERMKYYYYTNVDELYYAFNLLGIYDGSVYDFRNDFCYSLPWKKYELRTKESVYFDLLEILSNYSIANELKLEGIDLKYFNLYCDVDKEMLTNLIKNYQLITDNFEKINASNKAVMINKVLQVSNGFIYDEYDSTIAYRLNTFKFEKLKELISALGNETIMIFCPFKEDTKFLMNNLDGAVVFDGLKTQDLWNEGKIKFLLMSPYSDGFGLNLQFGGRVIVWFGLVWGYEKFIQSIKRLYRPEQKRDVYVYFLLACQGFDDYVLNVLTGKGEARKELIDLFKKYL